MASLVGQQLKDTYDSLLKTSDNDALGGTYKEITDGSGNGSNLYLGTGGKVGIGTNSPSKDLTINSATGGQLQFEYNTGGYLRIEADSGGGSYYAAAGLYHRFFTSGSERMRIGSGGDISFRDTGGSEAFYWDASAGSLGIGTTSPATALHIDQPSNDRAGGLYLEIDGSNYGLSAFVNSGGYGVIGSNGTFTTDVITMNLSNGNVGIGTSPSEKLEVQDGSISVGSSTNTSTTNALLSGYGYILSGTKLGNTSIKSTYNNSNNSASLEFYTDPNGSTPTERMRIDSSGNVKIGASTTATPSTNADDLVIDKGAGESGLTIMSTAAATLRFGDAGNSSIGALEYNHNSDYMRMIVNDSERMRIDSSGYVGINETNPLVPLHISRNTASGENIALILDNNNTTAGSEIGILLRSAVGSTNTDFEIFGVANGANDMDLVFQSDGSNERMRIDSSGNVGISTGATVDDKLHVVGTSTKIQEAGQTGITMKFNHGNNASVNSDINIANIKSFVSSGSTGSEGGGLTFETKPTSGSATPRMTIDSSGNVLVGKTTADDGATAGIEQQAGGALYIAKNATNLLINRLSTDGEIVNFRKDGTTVGSIGTRGGEITFHQGDTGIRLRGGTDNIIPVDASGAGRSNAIDIGSSSEKFKDLYLGGSIYLGGTTSANALDDYEEGTHDTTITCGTSGTITLGSSTNSLQFTKIGRLMTVTGRVAVSGVSSPSGSFTMSLPTTIADLDETSGRSTGDIKIFNTSTNCDNFFFTAIEGNAFITVFKGGSVNGSADSADTFGGNETIVLSLSYVSA